MPQDFYSKLERLLKKDNRFVDQEGDLLKSACIDAAYKADTKLIELLLSDNEVKNKFFGKVKDVLVFNINDFIGYVQDKNFLADSYTKYRNKIGLNIDGKFLNERKEVALGWPFKDCVLEGGQTREDAKRKEIFFNEVLAQDEIDRLLDPKVLTNWKRHTQNGEEEVKELKRYKDGTIRENFIIKGNNLLALHSLKKQFQNKVKLIYIDPPYNTGNDSFGYNDSFNHSAWLTFMKNRLEVARELLGEDGNIWINIDDGEAHYLKVLCDEVFGRENFVNNVIWQKKYSPQNDAKWLSDNHDHILLYAKNKSIWRPNLLQRSNESLARYTNRDKDPRGVWKAGDCSVKTYNEKTDYEIITPSGRNVRPPKGYCWRYSKNKFDELVKDNRIWFGEDGNNIPSIKRFLSEVQEGMVPKTLWLRDEVGDNQEAKKEINLLGYGEIFDTPKPEKLLNRILEIGSKKTDIVLDFFAGSGTTLAVAHKTGRQYIGIEQMDYIHDLPESRLKKVIGLRIKKSGKLIDELEFDEGGISKTVGWKGGGEFIYLELMQFNEYFMGRIQKADTTQKLLNIWKDIQTEGFMKWQVDLIKFAAGIEEFKRFPIDKQKRTLIDTLNKNQLYVNLSEIRDVDFKVSGEDKKINKEFYGDQVDI